MTFSPPATGRPRLEATGTIDPPGSGAGDCWRILRDHGLCNRRSRFVEISYRIDDREPPVRPILRLVLPDGARDIIMPAPTDGSGLWIGRLPAGWSEIRINPTHRPHTTLRVESVRTLSLRDVAPRLLSKPGRLFYAVAAGMVGLEEEAALNWRWALGCHAGADYAAWRSRRAAPAPCPDQRQAPDRFALFLDIDGAAAPDIEASCRAIQRQSQGGWRVTFVGTPADAAAAQSVAAFSQAPYFHSGGLAGAASGDSHVCRLRAGDLLAPTALAAFAACFGENPQFDIAYCDELRPDGKGGLRRVWRPGWSPTLQRSVGYAGCAFFFRGRLLDDAPDWLDWAPEDVFDRLVARAQGKRAGFVPRPLFTFPGAPPPCRRAPAPIRSSSNALVSIVIPTRDRADLLAACLDSLFGRTSYQKYEVVLVDNGSTEPRALALIDRLQAAHARLRVIRAPGPFNFSALSNLGAREGAGDYLLFLNNDTEILTPDWIERLLPFAGEADVGAVGAKLLFPDRRVQHAGVVLGMGGVAGHFGAGLREDAPGWWGRNLHPHEVSAVTGACLMVAREKFEAAGKFDAVNLPVDLNDVDLCLRLLEMGLRNICQSQVLLLHRQSASRGGGLRLQRVHAQERRHFSARWRNLIRDDPCFNPGLSLYAREERLP